MYVINMSNRTDFGIKPVIVSYNSDLPYVQHYDSKSNIHTLASSRYLFTTYYVCKSNEQWPNSRGVYSWLTRTYNVHNVKKVIVGKWLKFCHESGLTSVNCEFLTTSIYKSCLLYAPATALFDYKKNKSIIMIITFELHLYLYFFCRQCKGFQLDLKKSFFFFLPKTVILNICLAAITP